MHKIVLKLITVVFCCAFSISLYAEQYSQNQALALCKASNLSLPKPEPDGRIQTLNEQGSMSPVFDTATKRFIENSHNKKVLEIGGGYGKVMLEVIGKGNNTEYHLNDLDERHLFISAKSLAEIIDKQSIKSNLSPKISYISGDITNKDFNLTEQYDAILIARVMHFFTPEQMEYTIAKLSKALKPHGLIYVVAITPYVKRYQSFIPEYEKRLTNNETYPGYVNSLYDWLNIEVTSKAQQAAISKGPFMFLDDRVLTKEFTKAGFKIIECKMESLGYPSESWALDGRENVVLIAEKIV
jgi:SAM-dependent methyltransferase